MPTITNRLKHAWNVFFNKDPTNPELVDTGPGFYYRPDRVHFAYSNSKSIVTSVYNRIAVDAAAITIEHVKLDENGRFLEVIDSGLNNCLNLEANIDQTGRNLIQDTVISMLDEGCVAMVPVDTVGNPEKGSYDIKTMRVGRIVQWYPSYVRVNLYNEKTGRHEEITLPKSMVAIIENPLYSVINEPNSTMQRLVRKLALLDATDEKTASGKMNIIIQLPYAIKTDLRRTQAEKRRNDLEDQLEHSKYGVAYIDGTEKITQLNRSIDNNLMTQVDSLTQQLYSQLGITQEIMNGTADDKAMTNYYSRTIEPILLAIVDEMKRKFLTKTARSQRQSIEFFRNPFRLVPVSEIAEIADKFTRNEILTSNEVRQIIGMKPSDDPDADVLRNKNLNPTDQDFQDNNTSETELN